MVACHIYLIPVAKTNQMANLKVNKDGNTFDSKSEELQTHGKKAWIQEE